MAPPPLTAPLFLHHNPAPADLYTLSLHDALPISPARAWSLNTPSTCATKAHRASPTAGPSRRSSTTSTGSSSTRSEEHTSELQSHVNLVCRLLLEKKKKITTAHGKP